MKIIGLDVGEKRIGVAKADSKTRIAVPVGYIEVDGSEWEQLKRVAFLNDTKFFVLGLPRSNEGNETAQSLYARNFGKTLTEKIPGAKIRFEDESLTSVEAERRLKARKKKYERGDIDAEAASIILQDFIENFSDKTTPERTTEASPAPVKKTIKPTKPAKDQNIIEKSAYKTKVIVEKGAEKTKAIVEKGAEKTKEIVEKNTEKAMLNSKKAIHKSKKLMRLITIPIAIIVILGIIAGVLIFWYNDSLNPSIKNCNEQECIDVIFVVSEGQSVDTIVDNLKKQELIRSPFFTKIFYRISYPDAPLKVGQYPLNKGMSTQDIIKELVSGRTNSNVFNFTILPGETVANIKAKLQQNGYTLSEINNAFAKTYDNPVLAGNTAENGLEGYLFGETHEFYKNAQVEEIIETFLQDLEKVVDENDLVNKFNAQGLTLAQGIILASVIQKEAYPVDQPTVAQVFLSRYRNGTPLGSDVTATYAANKVDPERKTYIYNADVLAIDSCYNTRRYAGLPCGAISSPSLSALLAVANPTDTNYYYFLTGDDGKMYYSYTEDEHNQNIRDHCQVLCEAQL